MKESKDSECLDAVIIALCRDYSRRKRAVAERSVGRRVRMEYVYLNSRMLEGVGEITGCALAESMIIEIGNAVGFANSSMDCLAESTYKRYKKEAKINIARKLHLTD